MIKIKNLVKEIKGKRIIDIDYLEIKNGERVALIGPNGAGKTTLIETILNIQKKTIGKIEFDFPYKRSPTEKIGIQFQDANYPIGLSTQSIIDFFYEKTINPDKKYIDGLIKKLKIDEFINVDSASLSGGQAQRLNILLSLINKPRVLILDELTTGLDVKARNIIRKEIAGFLTKDKTLTLLIVTHIPMEVDQFCERIVRLENGKVIEDISKQKLLKKYNSVADYFDMV